MHAGLPDWATPWKGPWQSPWEGDLLAQLRYRFVSHAQRRLWILRSHEALPEDHQKHTHHIVSGAVLQSMHRDEVMSDAQCEEHGWGNRQYYLWVAGLVMSKTYTCILLLKHFY